MASYTFLWNNDTWAQREIHAKSGNNLIDYIAGDKKQPFSGFIKGDEIFIVTVKGGNLYVGGRLIVDAGPMGRKDTIRLLGRSDVIDKEVYFAAEKNRMDQFRASCLVDLDVAEKLELFTAKGEPKKPDLDRKGMIDRQTFRTPYRLSESSANKLRSYLDLESSPGNQSAHSVASETSDEPSNADSDDLTNPMANEVPIENYTLGEAIPAIQSELEAAASDLDMQFIGKPGKDIDVIAKSRVGQGPFRKLLIAQHGGKCCISGLDNIELLIASHIVRWSKSDSYQKTDAENGLLLSVSWDCVFDKGFVSFDEQGNLLCSEFLDQEAARLLGISAHAKIPSELLTDRRKQNLSWHRENVFRGESRKSDS